MLQVFSIAESISICCCSLLQLHQVVHKKKTMKMTFDWSTFHPARNCGATAVYDIIMRSNISKQIYSIRQAIKELGWRCQEANLEKGGCGEEMRSIYPDGRVTGWLWNWDRRSQTLQDNVTSSTLWWSKRLPSYEIKSLILISHCRLACNCLGSERPPALCSPTVGISRQFWMLETQTCSVEQLDN